MQRSWVILVLMMVLAPLPTLRVVRAASPPVQPAAEASTSTLLATLQDARLPQDARRAAAVSLILLSADDTASAALVQILASPSDSALLVVQAMASAKEVPRALLRPLVPLLLTSAEPAQSDLIAAIARHADDATLRRLLVAANNDELASPSRQAAIRALGQLRKRKAAEALVALTQKETLAEAADLALAQMTGLEPAPGDVRRWTRWWQAQRDLSDEAWTALIAEQFSKRLAEQQQRGLQVEKRLIEAKRQLFRSTPRDQQPAALVALLRDPMDSLRILGLELSEQQLIDARALDDSVRTAVRALLEDASGEVQQRATALLGELKDAPSADRIAKALAEGTERRPGVLRAYVLMMKRQPRALAVPALLDLLSHRALQAEAAAALAAAGEQKPSVLTSQQMAQAFDRIRTQLNPERSVPANFIDLLAVVTPGDQWVEQIQPWLDHADASLREAAARAWARSEQDLEPLASRSADPVIQPFFVAAAERRGRTLRVLHELLQVAAQPGQTSTAWQPAMVAVAGRVGPEAVLEADRVLAALQQPVALREQVLSAPLAGLSDKAAPALEDPAAPGSKVSPAMITLLLVRGELRLAKPDPDAATRDFQRVRTLAKAATAGDLERASMGLLRARLALGDVEASVEEARKLLQAAGAAPPQALCDRIADAFLSSATRSAELQQLERSSKLLAALKTLLGAQLSPAHRQQMELLMPRLAGAGSKAEVPVPAPNPPAPSP